MRQPSYVIQIEQHIGVCGRQLWIAVCRLYGGAWYVYRYAHEGKDEALELRGNLLNHFGKPSGVETDLGANFWPWDGIKRLEFTQRTTQKHSCYVQEPGIEESSEAQPLLLRAAFTVEKMARLKGMERELLPQAEHLREVERQLRGLAEQAGKEPHPEDQVAIVPLDTLRGMLAVWKGE